ncbi:MAG TPA: GPP34 family phosphoprotein [Thermoleophilaceae bacterium]|nr:GPP34 family phosphoprotein [Thermoleophilaceae bacterium]
MLDSLRVKVAEGLVARGVLAEERGRMLGLISRTRWPAADPEPERALRERLADGLGGRAEPQAREALLMG